MVRAFAGDSTTRSDLPGLPAAGFLPFLTAPAADFEALAAAFFVVRLALAGSALVIRAAGRAASFFLALAMRLLFILHHGRACGRNVRPAAPAPAHRARGFPERARRCAG